MNRDRWTANRMRLRWRLTIACWASLFAASPAVGITVRIDYTHDASAFFGGGNPQGAAAGAHAASALEAAAAYFTAILDDPFSPIVVPAALHSSVADGIATWEWARSFSNPSTGNLVSLIHSSPGQTIAADEYVVFAGARNLVGAGAGLGGPGGMSWTLNPTGGFTLAEILQINATTDAFQKQVERRGQPSGFANWGGSVAFDATPPTPWHFDHATPPAGNVVDFYSVAVHELAHALGFGASNEWEHHRTGLLFNGPQARASHGGSAVPLADAGHWANALTSVVFGGTASQPPLMSTVAPLGARAYFTHLDAAAMRDIGWNVATPVPEPTTACLLLLAVGFASNLPCARRLRRRRRIAIHC
jgi:hypothetical protein